MHEGLGPESGEKLVARMVRRHGKAGKLEPRKLSDQAAQRIAA